MIWLTWRQHRAQALFAVATLAVLAAVLVPTGLQMHHAFDDLGLAACLRGPGSAEFVDVSQGVCEPQISQFTGRFGSRAGVAVLLVFLPLLAGLFWGAPLFAREVEHGTHRLVWTQGVSRSRWAVSKLGLVGAGVALAAAAYALLVSWWLAPLNQATADRFSSLFDLQGLVPVGFTLFAVALGILAGTLTRKVMPAMAITLVGFLAVRILMEFLVRPHFRPLVQRDYPAVTTTRPNELLGDWIYTAGVHNARGDLISGGSWTSSALAICDPRNLGVDCASGQGGAGTFNRELIQPADRYWLFQGIETAVFVGLALLLMFAAVYWIRRRIS